MSQLQEGDIGETEDNLGDCMCVYLPEQVQPDEFKQGEEGRWHSTLFTITLLLGL
jgi:hypothetical protein